MVVLSRPCGPRQVDKDQLRRVYEATVVVYRKAVAPFVKYCDDEGFWARAHQRIR